MMLFLLIELLNNAENSTHVYDLMLVELKELGLIDIFSVEKKPTTYSLLVIFIVSVVKSCYSSNTVVRSKLNKDFKLLSTYLIEKRGFFFRGCTHILKKL